MQKEAEKACRLQEQLNELQRRINQDNVQGELDNALQREHEAQLLLQEHQRRIQELSNTLELHSCTNKDRSQLSNVPLMSLSNATEELRRRDQVLDHQNRLLKDTEQDQQQLQETLQEAERAIQQGAIDEELIINHIKAVEAALNEVRDEAVASAMPLPSLKTLSEEAMRDRPEAASFQGSLLTGTARIEALRTGRQSSQAHFESEAALVPLTPVPDESSHCHIDSEAGGPPPPPPPPPPPAPASAPPPPPPPPPSVAVPAAAPVPVDLLQPHISPQASGRAAAPIPAPAAHRGELRLRTYTVSGTDTTSTVAPDRTVPVPSSVVPRRTRTLYTTDTSSSVAPDRTGVGSSVDISSHEISDRTYPGSATNTLSSVTPDRTGFGSSMDMSSHGISDRMYPLSPTDTFSSVTPSRTGFGSSIDMSSHGALDRMYPLSPTDTLSILIPEKAGFESSMDMSPHGVCDKMYILSPTDTFSIVIPEKKGFGSSMDVCPPWDIQQNVHSVSNRHILQCDTKQNRFWIISGHILP
ncbi:uncharacterized protein LOC143692160 isoform X1 [Agelaius phoeniceus]|uniref:uncharacterized protein LOC143692160 isoform X1 n=1 Tax=Agelaius phoeniceus TaxID=39638 RepID=UPI004054CD1B